MRVVQSFLYYKCYYILLYPFNIIFFSIMFNGIIFHFEISSRFYNIKVLFLNVQICIQEWIN